MTSVAMVSGSWPPQACGVGDYTERLCLELEQSGAEVVRIQSDDLSKPISPAFIGQINQLCCDLVHIQYPTAGYGRSLNPSALAAAVQNKPVVVTLHEYAVFRWYRYPWFMPFALGGAARVFTIEEERNLFFRRFPRRKGRDLVIGIGSNIPVAKKVARVPNRVVHFGLIAPKKNIESFLDLCEIARAAQSGLIFDLVGAIPERAKEYASHILERAAACGVNVRLDLADTEVAAHLASSEFAYLPFPDGASAKRGTLAAALLNGVTVITRHSGLTPDWIKSATLAADTPLDAMRLMTSLRHDSRQRSAIAACADRAAQQFRWDVIARKHVDLYHALLDERGAGCRWRADLHAAQSSNDIQTLAS